MIFSTKKRSNKMNTVKSIFISLCLLGLSENSYAQNSGFIGKKNILSVDGRFFVPVFHNFGKNESKKYKANGEAFEPARNLLNSGINITVGRTLTNGMAFLIQGNYSRYKMYAPNYDYPNSFQINKSTFFQGQSMGIMPIIEFAGTGGILPIGISHQIGIGFYKNTMRNTDYLILAQSTSYSSSQTLDLFTTEDITNLDYLTIKSYSFMYKFNLRIPITRSLLLNVGMRYNINRTKPVPYQYDSATIDNHLIPQFNFRDMVAAAHLNNLVSLETGISFVF